jgi:hypothetical protein
MEPEVNHAAPDRDVFSVGGVDFVPATKLSVARCPARSDYIEVTFRSSHGRWKWCFPKPQDRGRKRPGSVALTIGPHGVEVRELVGNRLGSVLPTSSALATIVTGADTYLACALLVKG